MARSAGRRIVRDFGTRVPTWGMAGAPIVEGNLLIALVGGREDALTVAFDKETGRRFRARSPRGRNTAMRNW